MNGRSVSTNPGVDGVVAIRSLGEAYGLPGLRMGIAVATGELRDHLETARTSWGLSTRYEVSADGNFLRIATEEPTAITDRALEAGLLVADSEERIGWEDRVIFTQRTPEKNDRLLDVLGV